MGIEAECLEGPCPWARLKETALSRLSLERVGLWMPVSGALISFARALRWSYVAPSAGRLTVVANFPDGPSQQGTQGTVTQADGAQRPVTLPAKVDSTSRTVMLAPPTASR